MFVVNVGLKPRKRYIAKHPTKRIKGYHLVDNDMVNFLSGFVAALVAIMVIYVVTK